MKVLLLTMSLVFSINLNAQAWQFIERIDLLTDEDTSIAFVNQADCSKDCATLTVRADRRVFIDFNQFMKNNNDIVLEYRFDKNKIKSTDLIISTSGKVGFISMVKTNDFIEQLVVHDSLVIRGYDYRDRTVTFKVSLIGARDAITKLSSFKGIRSTKEINKSLKLAELREQEAELNAQEEKLITDLEAQEAQRLSDLNTKKEVLKVFNNQIRLLKEKGEEGSFVYKKLKSGAEKAIAEIKELEKLN